jgi:hypothetical protein
MSLESHSITEIWRLKGYPGIQKKGTQQVPHAKAMKWEELARFEELANWLCISIVGKTK